MWKRMMPVLLCLSLAVLNSGCVESKLLITLNPDGKGKIQIDALMSADAGFGAPSAKDTSLDELKQRTVSKLLTGSGGVAAWKDVHAEWNPDGRLHFTGTAFFENIDKLKMESILLTRFQLTRDKNGVLTLTEKLGDKGSSKGSGSPPPEPSKLSDKELDEEILKMRAGYQQSKPMLLVMFTDWKCRTDINLPGPVSDIKGFKKEGELLVSQDLLGTDVLKSMEQFMAKDNAYFRKKIRDDASLKSFDPQNDEFFAAMMPAGLNASLTIKEPGTRGFDFGKEIKTAVEAYPALRDQFHLDPKVQLPGEPGKPSGSSSVPLSK
jgi:hypothetical protein